MKRQFQFQIEIHPFYLDNCQLEAFKFVSHGIYIEVAYDQVFFWYVRCRLVNPKRLSFSVSENSQRKDSFKLFVQANIFLQLTFIFLFFLPLFLFLTLTESLEGVYIPTKSNCQSNFVNSCKNYSCNFFVSLIQMETAKTKTTSQPAITCSNLVTETLEQRCEICSQLTIKTPKRRHWCRFGVSIVNFEYISYLCSSVSIFNFEQVNAGWFIVGILYRPPRKINFVNCICQIFGQFNSLETQETAFNEMSPLTKNIFRVWFF